MRRRAHDSLKRNAASQMFAADGVKNSIGDSRSGECGRSCKRASNPACRKISKTTPCKVAEYRRAGCLPGEKHFDTSGKSVALVHHPAILKS
jgi:hypothetical protein